MSEQASRPAGTVLVTGAAGFIGSHVVERLCDAGREVVGLDDLDPYYDPAIKRRNLAALARMAGFDFVEGDIRDEGLVARLFADRSVTDVVHLAAKAGVRPSIANPALYADVNVRGSVVLMEAARRADARSFVLASSSSVYGSRQDPPFRESDPLGPAMSPYAATKQAVEALAQSFHALHGLDVTVLRFFNAYGPRQRPDMAVHKFSRLLLAGERIPFFGDGSSRRDHTYIADIVQGVVRAVERAPGRGYRVYNLGNTKTVTLSELVATVERVWGVTARLDRMPDQPGDVPLTCADVSLATEELGYRPTTDFAEGVERFAAWYREAVDAS